jgi:hypothetical protein
LLDTCACINQIGGLEGAGQKRAEQTDDDQQHEASHHEKDWIVAGECVARDLVPSRTDCHLAADETPQQGRASRPEIKDEVGERPQRVSD